MEGMLEGVYTEPESLLFDSRLRHKLKKNMQLCANNKLELLRGRTLWTEVHDKFFDIFFPVLCHFVLCSTSDGICESPEGKRGRFQSS